MSFHGFLCDSMPTPSSASEDSYCMTICQVFPEDSILLSYNERELLGNQAEKSCVGKKDFYCIFE